MSDSKVSDSDCIYSSENSANFPSCTPPSEFRPLILGRFQLCKTTFSESESEFRHSNSNPDACKEWPQASNGIPSIREIDHTVRRGAMADPFHDGLKAMQGMFATLTAADGRD